MLCINEIPEYEAAIAFNRPKKNAANKIRKGFHCPKIRTANARKPYPATVALNSVDDGTTNTKPPTPASTPDMKTPAYLIL